MWALESKAKLLNSRPGINTITEAFLMSRHTTGMVMIASGKIDVGLSQHWELYIINQCKVKRGQYLADDDHTVSCTCYLSRTEIYM